MPMWCDKKTKTAKCVVIGERYPYFGDQVPSNTVMTDRASDKSLACPSSHNFATNPLCTNPVQPTNPVKVAYSSARIHNNHMSNMAK